MPLSHRIPKFLDVLRQSERWPLDRLQSYQNDLLARLLRHAYKTVPFYADRLAPLFRRNWGPRLHKWDEISTLSRSQVMENQAALTSCAVPKDHGAISIAMSSGSTGEPVRIKTTQLADMENAHAVQSNTNGTIVTATGPLPLSVMVKRTIRKVLGSPIGGPRPGFWDLPDRHMP